MENLFPRHRFAGFLFDMDGTLLTSIDASRRVWGRWAARFGLDATTFLADAHGMQVRDVIAALALPGVDPGQEADWIFHAEMADTDGVRAITGAAAFLGTLPRDRWAIVTSAPRALARRRLEVAALPVPPVLIAAEDVTAGKPDPASYILAARRLDVDAGRCVVFEDAPVGVAAGRAAGAQVVTVTAAHRHDHGMSQVSAGDYRRLRVMPGTSPDDWALMREADDRPAR